MQCKEPCLELQIKCLDGRQGSGRLPYTGNDFTEITKEASIDSFNKMKPYSSI